jgi:hypothetical protein
MGALAALLLIHGIAPYPLDPVVLHFFIHNCDLHAIHPSFLSEWHPELCCIIQDWINMGSSGDPTPFQSHFASYHDLQVSTSVSCHLY